jgi:hypothetical protein
LFEADEFHRGILTGLTEIWLGRRKPDICAGVMVECGGRQGAWIDPVMAQLLMTGFGMVFPVLVSVRRHDRSAANHGRQGGVIPNYFLLNVGTSLAQSNRYVNLKSISKIIVDFK